MVSLHSYVKLPEGKSHNILQNPIKNPIKPPLNHWFTKHTGTRPPGLADGLGSPQATVHAVDLFEHGLSVDGTDETTRLNPSNCWCFMNVSWIFYHI